MKTYGVEYGKRCVIHGKMYFNLFKTARLVIGDNFYCTSGACVNAISTNIRGCFYATEHAMIKIGDNVGMSSPVIWCHERVTIGNNVKIGATTLIIDTDAHNMDYIVRRGQHTDWGVSAPIVIEDDVFIGAKSVVLKGVTIGARSVIGAGSVVTRNIPADCIAAGNPAKVIKSLK